MSAENEKKSTSGETAHDELEYNANLSIFFHADRIRQSRMNGFLSMNAFLLAAIGFLSSGDESQMAAPLVCVVSLVGVVLSRAIKISHVRNDLFLKYRRFQLRDLEARMGNVSTFSNSKQAFGTGRFEFPNSQEIFETSQLGRYNSGQIDRFVMDTFSVVWLLISIVAFILWL